MTVGLIHSETAADFLILTAAAQGYLGLLTSACFG
jgi:hypothetical protein